MDSFGRRFSDREVARIIQRAMELQDRSGEGRGSGDPRSGDGLSLEVVREIAAEIGVSPRFVEQAISGLQGGSGSSTFSAVLGGPLRRRWAASFPGRLSEEDIRALVDRLRAALESQGDVSDALGSVEWRTGELEPIAVTVSPRSDATDVQIIGDRAAMLAPGVVLPTFLGMFVCLIVGHELELAALETVGAAAAGGVAGLGVARALWTAASRRFLARLDRLQEEVRRFMPGAGPEEGDL